MKTGKVILILVLSILAAVVCLEGLLTAFKYLTSGTTKGINEYDDVLGWRPTPYYHKRARLKDCLGRDYDALFTSGGNGSRLWGTNRGKMKVLFLGDSFTQATTVSNDKTYYYRFAEMTGLDVYALGSDGYGTLQESLLLREVVKQLSPDIFVLQFCNNDFVNNSISLEDNFVVFQQRIRPYLVDGKIVYSLKNNKVFMFLFNNSRLFRLLLGGLASAQYMMDKGYAYGSTDTSARREGFRQSVQTTDTILGWMKSDLPHTRFFYAFNLDENTGKQFLGNDLNRILTQNGFTPLEGAVGYIKSCPGGEKAAKSADCAHLNEEGNLRLAQFLAKEICKRGECK